MQGMPERGHHGSDGELDKRDRKGGKCQDRWSTESLTKSMPVSPGFMRKGSMSFKPGYKDKSSSCPGSPSKEGRHPTSPCSHTPSCRTCPTSPCRSRAFINANGEDIIRHTNVDPMSVAAMTLDHFKARTTYGFETLKEMPHTRRKESLFHLDAIDPSGHNMSSINRSRSHSVKSRTRTPSPKLSEYPSHKEYPAQRGSTSGGDSPPDGIVEPPHLFVPIQRRKSSKRRNVKSMVAPLGVVLPDQCGDPIPGRILLTPSDTPVDSPSGTPDVYRKYSDPAHLSPTPFRYYRRRSSIQGYANRCQYHSASESSHTEGSSTEPR